MASAAQKWAGQAQYDLDTARAMLASDRRLYVLFCCQQAVEKALKAVVVDRSGEFPPRTHSLPRLIEAAGLQIEPARMDFFAELTSYYIQTRYPEEIESLGAGITRDMASETLRRSEEAVKWLLSMLK